jgi:hypothetical protein
VFFLKKRRQLHAIESCKAVKKTTPVYQGMALPTLNRQLSACKTVVAAKTEGTAKTKFNI